MTTPTYWDHPHVPVTVHSNTQPRPIQFARAPFDAKFLTPPKNTLFSLLAERGDPDSDPNTNIIDPVASGIPWTASFPKVKQCKFWRESEDAALELLYALMQKDKKRHDTLPQMLNDSRKGAKMQEIVETATTCAINMYPSASPDRIRILTKVVQLLFWHDDVTEYADTQNNETCLDPESQSVQTAQGIFAKFREETLRVDPVLGPPLLKGMLDWARFTREKPASPNMQFSSWDHYIQYRHEDIAFDYVVYAARFVTGLRLTPEEEKQVQAIEVLFVTHAMLTNDFFSFEKEVIEARVNGGFVINAVTALEQTLHVSTPTAKVILQHILWDLEKSMHDFYEAHLNAAVVNDNIVHYVRRMIECLAGNWFYSATTRRYSEPLIKMCGSDSTPETGETNAKHDENEGHRELRSLL